MTAEWQDISNQATWRQSAFHSGTDFVTGRIIRTIQFRAQIETTERPVISVRRARKLEEKLNQAMSQARFFDHWTARYTFGSLDRKLKATRP